MNIHEARRRVVLSFSSVSADAEHFVGTRHTEHLHVFVPIAGGSAIYFMFRAKSLLVFRWFSALGLEAWLDAGRSSCRPLLEYCPEWVLYSLPDALWAYALTSFMVIVWRRHLSCVSFVWILLGPLLSIGGELGQLFGVVPGTFDAVDLALCFLSVSLSMIVLLQNHLFHRVEGQSRIL